MKITRVNLFCLGELFGVCTVKPGPQTPLRNVPNGIDRASARHLRRCMQAGLLAVQGDRLVLTDEGDAQLRAAIEGVRS